MIAPFQHPRRRWADRTNTALERMTPTFAEGDGPARHRVWTLTVTLAALAGVVFVTQVQELPAPGVIAAFPWWAAAALFFLAEIFPVHVQVGRESYSYSLSEIPLVLGLFFLEPQMLVAAQLLGAGMALLIHRRQSGMKLAFNLTHLALQAEVAVLIFGALTLTSIGPTDPRAWAMALSAAIGTVAVADVSIWTAMSLFEGGFDVRLLARGFLFSRVMLLTNTCLGVLIAGLLIWEPWSVVLLIVPIAGVQFAYRGYSRQRDRRQTLESLQRITRTLHTGRDRDSVTTGLLSQTRELFNAEIAEIFDLPNDAGQPASRTTFGPGDLRTIREPVLDPTEGVWARVAAEGEALVFTRPLNSRLGHYFDQRGIRDAMVAPLFDEGDEGRERVAAVLLVANRESDVATFDKDDLNVLETLAHHAESTFQNLRLLQHQETSLERMTELNEMKDDFVAVVSHELRTPLTVVQGALKSTLHAATPLSDEVAAELLASAERGANRLQRLIEQLLTVSSLERCEARLASDEIWLQELIAVAASDYVAKGVGNRLSHDVPPDLPAARGDGAAIHQIIGNLLDNALKYSGDYGHVRVTAAAEDSEVVVAVHDQGPGIPSDHREAVFDRFFQVDASATRTVGGLGLGLHISRSLAEALGGRLWIERSDASGSELRLSLPAAEPRQGLHLASARVEPVSPDGAAEHSDRVAQA